jgi:hypothetical protein
LKPVAAHHGLTVEQLIEKLGLLPCDGFPDCQGDQTGLLIVDIALEYFGFKFLVINYLRP